MAEHKPSKPKPLRSGSLKMPGFNDAAGDESKISFSEERFQKAAKSLLPDWERKARD